MAKKVITSTLLVRVYYFTRYTALETDTQLLKQNSARIYKHTVLQSAVPFLYTGDDLQTWHGAHVSSKEVALNRGVAQVVMQV